MSINRIPKIVYFVLSLAVLVDETIQLYYPGRSGQITDLWVDLSGVILGILVVGLLMRLTRRRCLR